MQKLLLAAIFAFGIGAPAVADAASYGCTALIGIIGNVAHIGAGIGGCYMGRLDSGGTITDVAATDDCRIYSGTSNANYAERDVGDEVAAGEDLFAVCDLPVMQEEITVIVDGVA